MPYKHETVVQLVERYGGHVGETGPMRFTATLNNARLWWRCGHSGYVSGMRRWDSTVRSWTRRLAKPHLFVRAATVCSANVLDRMGCQRELVVYVQLGREPAYGFQGGTPRLPLVGTQEYALVESVLRREAPIEVLVDYLTEYGILDTLG